MTKWLDEYNYYTRAIGGSDRVKLSDDYGVVVYPNRIEYRHFSHGFQGRHRIDGPALIYYDNRTYWYLHGFEVPELHEWAETMSIDLDNITEDDKTLILMVWNRNFIWSLIQERVVNNSGY